jgi:hypothetical protein
MSAVNPLPSAQPLRKQFLELKAVAKRVQIEVLSQDNKRVIRRFRFVPPSDAQGRKTRFTSKGVDHVLENFVDSFERDNPDHKYRLVVCKDKYKLVWTPEESGDPVIGASDDRENSANVCAEAVRGRDVKPPTVGGPPTVPYTGQAVTA